ncbi:hypothetical protein K431DRAFT_65828 [Polychaeton citri CBS 116435]|uniref:Uncharacterized protein n=1 Tax=Polychaeton citri CBS 116435 TaxID=1314669 RepID=A0A9P4UPD1_9PEZI|nr:hypothetical protein K431DRAFT_65828 [Polychaeton citri CBS 116435]
MPCCALSSAVALLAHTHTHAALHCSQLLCAALLSALLCSALLCSALLCATPRHTSPAPAGLLLEGPLWWSLKRCCYCYPYRYRYCESYCQLAPHCGLLCCTVLCCAVLCSALPCRPVLYFHYHHRYPLLLSPSLLHSARRAHFPPSLACRALPVFEYHNHRLRASTSNTIARPAPPIAPVTEYLPGSLRPRLRPRLRIALLCFALLCIACTHRDRACSFARLQIRVAPCLDHRCCSSPSPRSPKALAATARQHQPSCLDASYRLADSCSRVPAATTTTEGDSFVESAKPLLSRSSP